MRARWWAAALGLGVVVAAAVIVVLVASKGDTRRTPADHGIRWWVDGPDAVITVTEGTPAATRARLRGRLVVACQGSGLAGAPEIDGEVPGLGSVLSLGSVRFSAIPQTVRVRLSPPLTKIDLCALERPGITDNLSFVRFAPDPVGSDGDGTLVIR